MTRLPISRLLNPWSYLNLALATSIWAVGAAGRVEREIRRAWEGR